MANDALERTGAARSDLDVPAGRSTRALGVTVRCGDSTYAYHLYAH